ncbi:MAG: DNA-processing protein DprA [Clostridia bacterium]|nr:DNA-processing protein DprA [Clostridia bacterium]
MYSEKNYIMWLNSLTSINVDAKQALIETMGSAQALWNSDRNEIAAAKILQEEKLELLIRSRYKYDIEKELNKLYHSGAEFYVPGDKKFPLQLTAMNEPPMGIYVIGKIPDDTYPMVSIVGSRRISDYGASVGHNIARELAEAGVTVVSGMAMGVDAIAHRGAIDGGGSTIAVLGTGVDVCYPVVNTNLYNEIKLNGCLISEFPLGTKAYKANFPYRNRIIAGLSKATVVVEATERSGSLITANKAIENSRIVMAVPGNVTSALSKGCNVLLRRGCIPVTCAQDILEDLGVKLVKKELKKSEKDLIPLAKDEKMLYDCISYEPISADELVERLRMDTREITCLLTMLELKGCIRRLSGQKVVRSL